MPKQYIEVNKAFEVLTDYYHQRTEIQHLALKEALDRIPTADVVEVKHGKWIRNNDSDHAWKCSVCGCGYTDYILSYCYDCGAQMERSEDEKPD